MRTKEKVVLTGESTPLIIGAYSSHRHGVSNAITQSRKLQRRALLLIFVEIPFVAAIVFITIYLGGHSHLSRSDPKHHHDHTMPTLLSIRDQVLGKYVNALVNPVYEEMKGATFIHTLSSSHEMSGVDTPANQNHGKMKNHSSIMQLNKEEISFHDALQISWIEDDVQSTLIQDSDVIAMYCPASEKNPAKFKDAATIGQVKRTTQELRKRDVQSLLEVGVSRGLWSIESFPIVREDSCVFRLWKRMKADRNLSESKTLSDSFILLGSSNTLSIRSGRALPTLVHLALTATPSEMLVHFTTGIDGVPIVLYGTDPLLLNTRAEGASTTYTNNDLCQAPASVEEPGKFTTPGMLHTVIMTDLKEDTVYYYKVAVEQSKNPSTSDKVVWSETFSFRSAIFPGSKTSYSYLVYADQGVPGYSMKNAANHITHNVVKEAYGNTIRAVHHFGDLSYANGVGHMWDTWLDMISSFSAKVPLMIGVGNHEYDHTAGGENGKDPSGITAPAGFMPVWGNMGSDSNGECGVPVAKRFTMPSNGNGIFWYSYDFGMVHTTVLSSEHDLSPASAQYQWLANDLRTVDRRITPWLIVEIHRPMYNSLDIPGNNLVGEAMRREFEHLLRQYQVDLFLAGHVHTYLRTCNGLYQSRCDAGGPTHITIGSGGAPLDLTVPLLRRQWTASLIREWGYGRITVVNSTALHFEFISDGTIKDEIWLYKKD